MSTQIIIGLLINTLSFAYMGFTNEKTGIRVILPRIILNKVVDFIITVVLYPLSFLIILFSPGNLFVKIGICLFMHFFVNHIVWGVITGMIAGLIIRRKHKKLYDT